MHEPRDPLLVGSVGKLRGHQCADNALGCGARWRLPLLIGDSWADAAVRHSAPLTQVASATRARTAHSVAGEGALAPHGAIRGRARHASQWLKRDQGSPCAADARSPTCASRLFTGRCARSRLRGGRRRDVKPSADRCSKSKPPRRVSMPKMTALSGRPAALQKG